MRAVSQGMRGEGTCGHLGGGGFGIHHSEELEPADFAITVSVSGCDHVLDLILSKLLCELTVDCSQILTNGTQ